MISNKVNIGGNLINNSPKMNEKDTKGKKFCIKKKLSSEVEVVTIRALSLKLHIFPSNSHHIIARVKGKYMCTNTNLLKLEAYIIDANAMISVKMPSYYCIDDAIFEVFLPPKMYKCIVAETTSGNIVIDNGIKTERIISKTVSGNISLKTSNVEDIRAKTASGNIDMDVKGKFLTYIRMETKSGNMNLLLGNVQSVEFDISNYMGKINKCLDNLVGFGCGYGITAFTYTGNIFVKSKG